MNSPSKDTVLFATLVVTAIAWVGLSATGPSDRPVALGHAGPGLAAIAVHDGTDRALCAATRADPATLVAATRTTC